MYAQVTADTITAEAGRPPTAARRLDTGQWVLGLRDAPAALQEACGWFAVVDTPRPDDTDTTTHDRSLELVGGAPTVAWTQRAKTIAEQADRYPSESDSLKAAARLVVIPKIQADELKDADAEQFAGLFPDWVPGIAVAVGEVYRWDGTLVEVIQAHTTQSDWTPDVVPSLFKIHRSAGDAPQPWVQPVGAHDAYQIGERVTHNGQTWESTAANNVWAPGVFGWVVV